MTEAQIHKFIFAPGFSTADDGHQRVRPRRRHGRGARQYRPDRRHHRREVGRRAKASSFTIKIPLTLAIVSALIVEAGGERFAIPQLAVVELVRARSNSEHRIERIKDAPVLRLRNKLLPLVHLETLLEARCAERKATPENGFIVVTQVGSQTFGIVVDGVFHTEEIVVKPMSSKLRHIAMFSGNTILGDGSVILIIDPNGIAQTRRHGGADAPRAESGATRERRRGRATDVAAGVPRRLAAAEGGAALAGHPARGDRLQARSSSRTAASWCSTAAS